MGEQVVMGATLMCDMGAAPASLSPTPNMVTAGGMGAATIMDFNPMENIPTFGMCMSPSNPEVAAATAAAMGVLTPQPCVPMTSAPWTPGSPTVTIGDNPALTADSTCMCDWGGTITISVPGQMTVTVAG